MEQLTYFDGGKWRLKIGDTEYSGKAVDRLAAYEDTGLEPEEVADFDRLVKLYLEAGLDKQFVLACIEATKAGITVDRLHELAKADKEDGTE